MSDAETPTEPAMPRMYWTLAGVDQEIEENKKALENKYGKVSINLQDGTYEEIVEEAEEVKA